MYREHTVGVVVPAYNEAGFVGEVIETLPEFVDRIYAVDDCSTDGTWDEIQRAAERVAGEAASEDAPIDPESVPDPAENETFAATNYTDPAAAAEAGDESPSSNGAAVADDADDASADERDGSATPRSDGGEASEASRSSSEPRSDGGVAAGAASVGGQRVVPIRHEENRGVGGAIKTGYQRAREDEMDVTVVVGGDGQMDPDDMPRLLDPIVEGRAEYAKGNRLLNPEHHEEMPFHRVVGNGILTVLTKIATGYWQVGDPQMGYTAISLEALEEAEVDEMYEYFGYCNDLLVRLSSAGCRVADVPCPLAYGDEESHIDYSEYVPRVSAMLLTTFLRRLWTTKDSPAGVARLGLFVGGAAAAGGGLLGGLVGALRSGEDDAADAGKTVDGDDAGDASGSSGAALSFLAGVASLLAAMLVDATANAPNNYTEHVPEDDE